MASLELPHWLMIAGALLLGAGSIGLFFSGRKSDEADIPPDKQVDLLPFPSPSTNQGTPPGDGMPDAAPDERDLAAACLHDAARGTLGFPGDPR
jgi:hypothetical protein